MQFFLKILGWSSKKVKYLGLMTSNQNLIKSIQLKISAKHQTKVTK